MSDSGSIVVGWLTKLVMLFAVLGLLAFDGFTLMVSNFGAADDAGTAAAAAAENFRGTKSVQAAYDAAVRSVGAKDTIETTTFAISPTGEVTLTVERKPTTLWMQYVGPLKKWTVVHQSGTGNPPS